MVVIGLTGNIGSGKSTVSQVLRELGALVIDADRISREVCEPGQPGWEAIWRHFGQEVFLPDGTLDRKRLGEIVFGQPDKLALLNSLLHPLIVSRIKEDLEEARASAWKAVVVDAALLFEVGLDKVVDVVWVVTADDRLRLERVMARDGLSREAALARMQSQSCQWEKASRADAVIDNSGGLEHTRRQVLELWYRLVGHE
ncbi:MAG: dephospho-CoA kinase [Bacillota bacterium]